MDSKNIGFDSRQGSIYSLTFDEFQSTLGGTGRKDFGSMNMDEFLKNIWTAEENQAMSSILAGSGAGAGAGAGAGVGLQRQGSSLTLPRTVSQKTVDEVWRNLVSDNGDQGSAAAAPEFHPQRQPTLGEMTLEEFLARAGVVREDLTTSVLGSNNNNNINNNSSSRSDLFYGDLASSYDTNSGLPLGFSHTGRSNGNVVANPVTDPMGISTAGLEHLQETKGGGVLGFGNPVINSGPMSGMVGLGGAGVTVAAGRLPANNMTSNGMGKENREASSMSPLPFVFCGGLRGRKFGGAVEKVVERRQRRMIKNRESAARSRARKQAYTMELEAEVAKLKEQNNELQKKQAEMLKMQKTKVLELINQPRGLKKRGLERTQTGPW